MGEGAARADRGYRLFECLGKARPACSSHAKQLFVWGELGLGPGAGEGAQAFGKFLVPQKGRRVPRPPRSENVPTSLSALELFMWELMGCCPAGGGGPGILAPPLLGCGKELSTKGLAQ